MYLNRTLLEAQNYDAVRLVLGHELVHVGQSNAHPELDAELARIQADTLAHELAGTAYSAERAQEIQRFFANIEGYARYVEDRLLELYTHGTTIMGAKLAARGAIRTRKLRNAPSAFVRDDAAPTFEELLHAGMLGKRTQYTAGRDAYVARATEGAIVKFDPALRPELQLSGVAIGALELLADRGSSAALLQLALLYLQGRGVTKDLEKAKHWLRRAIDSGVAEAGVLLAGLLPIEDPERARLLRPSATQGHAEAQYILGVTLLRAGAADVPAQDREEGVLMLENAAAQGLVAAMRDLAKLYDQGLAGVPRDVVKGRLWTRRADAAEKRRPD
ncbi:MAG TPA: tetratricopeptide repeat protein [Labilithrix sp.]